LEQPVEDPPRPLRKAAPHSSQQSECQDEGFVTKSDDYFSILLFVSEFWNFATFPITETPDFEVFMTGITEIVTAPSLIHSLNDLGMNIF
jgi:hypothetical protein